MKTILFAFGFALVASSMVACTSGKVAMAKHKAEMMNSKESASGCFVEFNDGRVQTYNSLTMRTGVFATPCLMANGNQKLRAKDIRSYQTLTHYAVSQTLFVSGRETAVATEALPGFAVRIAKGRINVYSKKYYNGRVAVDEYFIQKGDHGVIMAYTAETMNLLVKDDPEALDFFVSKQYKTPQTSREKYAKATNELNLMAMSRKK